MAPERGEIATGLRLLGPPELDFRRTLRFRPERRFRLLVYLALQGKWSSRDELGALFWPDRPQEAARSNLRKLLLEVRALKPPDFQSERNTVRWDVPTDVAQLRAAVARGDHEAVLALYRGPLADGLEGGDSAAFAMWLTAERARLNAAWRAAAVKALPRRPAAAALELARQLLADDPLDEEALCVAMRTLSPLGRRDDALQLYREFAERAAEELGVEVASEPRALATALQEASTAVSIVATQADEPSGFIGRAQELAALMSALGGSDCRLVTVTGPGGIGKSRLVRQSMPELEPRFRGGILWIPLDDLSSIEAVAQRIVQLAQLEHSSGAAAGDQVEAWLAARELLLVLDNAEHLPLLPPLLARWLEVGSRLKCLVTSRQRLGLPGERVLPLAGLALPERGEPAAVAASDAGALFIRRAREQHPRFDGGRHAHDIARLVRAVDGMPLAIELAAGWVRYVPPRELADEMSSSSELLQRSEAGDERPEHRSLGATLELSWRLLAPAEQRAFAALSVFAGSFTRAAAKAIAGASMPVLAALADRSLLQAEVSASGGARFRLHPLLRQFAGAQREATGGRRDLQARHARHFAQWLSEAEQALRASEQPDALLQLELHLPDCRAAWDYAVATRDAAVVQQAALPLMYYYEARGWRAEGIALFSAALGAFTGTDLAAGAARAMLLRALSTVCYRSGQVALTLETAAEGVTVARRCGARAALKGCLLNLGLAHWQRGHWEAARDCFVEALGLARDDHDVAGVGAFVTSLAMVEHEMGAYDDAEAHYREGLHIDRGLRRPRGLVTSLNNLAGLLLDRDRAAEALPLLDEGLRLCSEYGITVMRANFLLGLARVRFALSQWPAAQELALQAAQAADDGGEPHLKVEAQSLLARIGLAVGDGSSTHEHAQQAVRLAMALDNAPVLLNAVSAVGECRAAAGDAYGAAALWWFVAGHPQTTALDRRHALALIESAGLSEDERSSSRNQAQRFELSTLSIELVPLADPRTSSTTAEQR